MGWDLPQKMGDVKKNCPQLVAIEAG